MPATASSVTSASIAMRLSAYRAAAWRSGERVSPAGAIVATGVAAGGRVVCHRQCPSPRVVRMRGSITEYRMSTIRLMVMKSMTITIR